MTSEALKISIIIPTYNRYVQLKNLLEELLRQKNALGIKQALHIVVVCDGSTDETLHYLQAHPEIEVVHGNGNWWFTRSVNEGASRAIKVQAPHYLHILNDDCTLPQNYLLELFTLLEERKSNPPALFGPITVDSADHQRVLFAGTTLRLFGLKRTRLTPNESPRHSDVLPGRGMTIATELFTKLGGLDERFLQYHSDEDFCLSAKKWGVTAQVFPVLKLGNNYLMTAAGSSIKKTDMRSLLRTFVQPQSRNYLRDRVLVFWKHQPKIALPILLAIQYFLIVRANYKKSK